MRPTVPEVLPLVNALYSRPGGRCGCCLHIVLDDDNAELDNARYCLDYAKTQDHADCIEIAELLVLMSRTQRHKLYRLHK